MAVYVTPRLRKPARRKQGERPMAVRPALPKKGQESARSAQRVLHHLLELRLDVLALSHVYPFELIGHGRQFRTELVVPLSVELRDRLLDVDRLRRLDDDRAPPPPPPHVALGQEGVACGDD